MGRIKWVAAAVLGVALFGAVAVGGTPSGDAAVGDTHRMTIPAAAFAPTIDDWDYFNNGSKVESLAGASQFTAPLVFPVDLDHVRITKVTFWAYDDMDDFLDVCLTLYRAEPKNGTHTLATQFCSEGPGPSVRSFSDRTFRPRTGRTNTSFYLNLYVPPDTEFYGATIEWKEI